VSTGQIVGWHVVATDRLARSPATSSPTAHTYEPRHVMRLSLASAWRTDLPRVVLLLQAGNAFSWFGYGLILPFEIIYLNQFRGFSTATAGLVPAAILGAGTLVTLPSGALFDRVRAKPILIAANLASALGSAGLAFVDRPWQAFACAVPDRHRREPRPHHRRLRAVLSSATCCSVEQAPNTRRSSTIERSTPSSISSPCRT